jgi:hypothetical protein
VRKQRRIASFATSRNVNSRTLPFASAVLYSLPDLPIASLRSSIPEKHKIFPSTPARGRRCDTDGE